jgi:hypothetical protein
VFWRLLLGRLLVPGGVLVAVATALAPAARAATFGVPVGTPPFNVAPNNPYDCSSVLTPIGPTEMFSPTGGPASSCIWTDVPTPAELQAAAGANISLEPPGSGTVTQVRVAVGAHTGAMQVVVMRALYENTLTPGRPNDACCTPVARSQVFTPQANAITTVNVNLPVREDATPPPQDTTTIADFDTLALAVLEPGVPVPMYYTGDLSQPADFVWNTATPSTVTPGFYTDTGGFFVALNATWSAPAGNGGGPPITFGGGAPVRNLTAAVPLTCASVFECDGQLLLQDAATGRKAGVRKAARARSHKPTTYGGASFKIQPHKRKAIKVKLSRAGRRLLHGHHTAKVWANVRIGSGKTAGYSARIKLHR